MLSHAHPSRLPLNGVRIAGTSAAIALHALVLMLLLTPSTWTPPKVDPTVESPPVPIDFLTIKPPPAPPTPQPVTNVQRPTPAPPVSKPVQNQDVAVISDSGPPIPIADVTPVDTGTNDPPSIAATELGTDVAPTPPYPAIALRDGTTGMVILRINVDPQGRPVSGSIERSSGSHLLDQSALKFVLAHWHFVPPMQAGKPVGAVGLVPIAFTLD